MTSEKCFCAFCKHQRRVYKKKHIGPVNILLSVFASLAIMMGIWQSFDARVIIIFASCLIVAELFVTLRWRLSMPCPHCGFDPVLYLKDPKLACQKVTLTIDQKRQQTQFYLNGKNPLTHLAKRPKPTVKDELVERQLGKMKLEKSQLQQKSLNDGDGTLLENKLDTHPSRDLL